MIGLGEVNDRIQLETTIEIRSNKAENMKIYDFK